MEDNRRPRSGRGRPRTEGVEDRILEATRRVISERGYDEATVDEIAQEAGVSKGSVYRRWRTKGLLVYDARFASGDELTSVIDSGDIRADLLAVALLTTNSFREPGKRDLFRHIAADAQRDPDLMALLRTRFFAPRSDVIVQRVEVAIKRGELRPGINVGLVPALLNGSQEYVWAVRGRALSDEEVHDLVDTILGPWMPSPRTKPSRKQT